MALSDARRTAARVALACKMAGLAVVSGAGVASASMATGGLTSQPIGHYDFCRANPRECSTRMRDPGPAVMTDRLATLIRSVNRSVNRAVKPLSDMDIFGREEVWAYPDMGVGDCEDYALEKRRRLAKSGVSLANLLITVVRKPDGEGHAVLTVRTTKGDFVLDNLVDAVLPWQDTDYRYLKRQSSEHTGRWVSIRGEQNVLVGSVR